MSAQSAAVMSLSPRYVSKLSCGHDAQKMDARRSCPRDCAEHVRRLRDVALAAGLTRCQCLRLHTGSPLHLAAAGSHLETAKVLVDAKANVNLKDGLQTRRSRALRQLCIDESQIQLPNLHSVVRH